MVWRVAICDDRKEDALLVAHFLEKWAGHNGVELSVVQFPSAESFLFHYEEDPRFDLLLLDIEMGAVNGIALAREIRTQNQDVIIVFITGYSDYAAQGYDVEALHYLLKPLDEEKFCAILDRVAKHIAQTPRQLLLNTPDSVVRIATREVAYVEAMGHLLHIHLQNGVQYEARMSMKEMGEKLGAGFTLCHRSYWVNLNCVQAIARTEVVLDDGTRLPLSRRMYDAVHRAFIDLYKEEG